MQKQIWQWRQQKLTPSTLLGGILSAGVVGTAALWLWAKQHPVSSELSIILIVTTLIFWDNVMKGVLKLCRLITLFRECGVYSYEVDIPFAFFIFVLLFTMLLILMSLLMTMFPLGGSKSLLLMFLRGCLGNIPCNPAHQPPYIGDPYPTRLHLT